MGSCEQCEVVSCSSCDCLHPSGHSRYGRTGRQQSSKRSCWRHHWVSSRSAAQIPPNAVHCGCWEELYDPLPCPDRYHDFLYEKGTEEGAGQTAKHWQPNWLILPERILVCHKFFRLKSVKRMCQLNIKRFLNTHFFITFKNHINIQKFKKLHK